MIVVVCLNPALDITHHVANVDWNGVNRAAAVYARPGGKGANVARTLHSFGIKTVLLGLAGGPAGAAVQTGLRELAVPAEFTAVAGETRRAFTVVDGNGSTALFNEPGPEITAAEYARFRAAYTAALPGATVVVLPGSLPRGLTVGSYAGLVKLAVDAGVPAVLDTSGDPLRHGIAAGPAIVKPNLAELRELSGHALSGPNGGADAPAVAPVAGEFSRDAYNTGLNAVTVNREDVSACR